MESLRYDSWSAAPGMLPRQGYLSCLNDTRNTYASLFCTSNPFLLLRPAFLCTVSEHPGVVGTTRNRESKVRACAEVHSTIQLPQALAIVGTFFFAEPAKWPDCTTRRENSFYSP
ncbi:hypothetical protein M404DRAFT_313362 [Pisolithus tinctorius Marx 270]|uniref:Uncharacterized protein n=1 Tax=Pisolithus tinctorius Marx 270 TaxID=870435 RepID=A0A0C3N3B5_PISTI|nr:hypothetical protein M404DRAFT_313362 [Pisolithus tinctorius Marx 270]